MRNGQWLNHSQPQTLQYAVLLLYINAAFWLLDAFAGGFVVLLLFAVAAVGAGWGIANEHKWGYGLGLGVAFAPFALSLLLTGRLLAGDIITLAFEILLIVLLLHNQSREYQRIWFK